MTDKIIQDKPHSQKAAQILKNWTMIALILTVVFLYIASLFGWLKSLADANTIARLELVVFILVGYCLGRFPAQQSEKTLRDEINRQTQKADAAQHIKEQIQQEREALEEKIKNAKTVLSFNPLSMLSKLGFENGGTTDAAAKKESLKHSVETAVKILSS